jgi:hypothetical protein
MEMMCVLSQWDVGSSDENDRAETSIVVAR